MYFIFYCEGEVCNCRFYYGKCYSIGSLTFPSYTEFNLCKLAEYVILDLGGGDDAIKTSSLITRLIKETEKCISA